MPTALNNRSHSTPPAKSRGPEKCRRYAAEIALLLILLGFSGTNAQTIRVDVSLQQVTATVTDSEGKLVTDLNPEDFTVELGGAPQQIAHFTRDRDVPFSVGLILDTSTSMETAVSAAKNAASTFIAGMHPRDESFLMTFDMSANVRQGFTHDPTKLFDALGNVTTGGGTALIGAVTEATKKMAQAANRKRALIVISDGGDSTAAEAAIAAFHDRIAGMETLIYAVQVQDIDVATAYAKRAPPQSAKTLPLSTAAYRPDLAHELMESMADESGGRYFYIDLTLRKAEIAQRLKSAFEDIFAELRGQYTIGFYPSSGASEARVRVRTVNPNYHVRTGPPQLGGPIDSDDDPYEAALQTAQEADNHEQYASEIQELDHATKLNSVDPRAFRMLGRAYVLTNEYRKAFEALNNLQSLTALTADDHFLMGLALLQLNDAAAAETHLHEAIALNPDYPQTYLQLYGAYIKLNKPQEALSILNEYLKRFPNDRNRALAIERADKLRAILKP